MKKKLRLLKEAVRLVWVSAPGWTSASIIISLLRSIFPLVLVFLVKQVVDGLTDIVAEGSSTGSSVIFWSVIALVVVYFLDEISGEAGEWIRRKQALKLEEYMYGLIHSKAISLDLENFENPEYFDCLARAVKEAPWRPNNILNNSLDVLRGFLSLFLMAGLILTLNWWLAVMLLLVNVPAIWLRLRFASTIYNFQKTHTAEGRKAAYFNWLLTGDRPAREIRLFNLGEYFRSLFNISFRKQKEEEINIIRKRTQIDTFSILFKSIALLIALLFISQQTIAGVLSLGATAMLILAFRQGMIYLKNMFISLSGLFEDTLFLGDMFEFLSLRERIAAEEPVSKPGNLTGKISVRELSFTYPGNTRPAIDNISFELKKDEIVAFVGHNGAGKSTLVKLLCRLYDPSDGSIMYNGINIRNYDPVEYRKMFSVVFQDFMLYNMSIGENIRIGDLESAADDDKTRKAAKTTGIDRLIESLPSGYETAIGNLFDDSRELSWGEWQKLALSRSLFRAAPVLILDEPSSALDADTEYEIFSRFRDIVKGRTSVLISHRFTNVKLADRIFVLNEGAIRESGTHDELMSLKGLYYNMFIKQSSRFGNE